MATQTFEVFEKGPEDYVTSIDAALDRQLGEKFNQLFPQDGVITEENAQSRQLFQADFARLWCIDPLDGTEDFIQGKPDYAVMVGLLQNHQPIAGWVYAPSYDRLYYGGRDWGVFETTANQPPVAIAPPAPFSPHQSDYAIVIGNRDRLRFGAAIARHVPQARFYSLGSFGLKVMEVLLGRAALYLYFNRRVKLWDTTGPIALANAAGLVCCDLEGKPLAFTPQAIALDSLTHQQPIVIGTAPAIEVFLPKLQSAVQETQA